MEILYKDLIFGDFRVSNYGLIVGTFTYNNNSEDELGMRISTIEEFIGHNPVPVYLGQKYEDKLKIQLTLIKNPLLNDLYFRERDCRELLRILTGKKGYQWLKLISHDLDEDLWYKAKVNDVTYKRIANKVVGIMLNLECDSCFAWSKEMKITINAKANQHFYIFNNTDDLNDYVYPHTSILSPSAGDLSVTNLSDNNWMSKIENVSAGEKISINSKEQIISSNLTHNLLLNDFNLGWIRLVPDKNEFVSNKNITITMKYRVPRKVGLME